MTIFLFIIFFIFFFFENLYFKIFPHSESMNLQLLLPSRVKIRINVICPSADPYTKTIVASSKEAVKQLQLAHRNVIQPSTEEHLKYKASLKCILCYRLIISFTCMTITSYQRSDE